MTQCPVCQSFESEDHEALEDHIDICLVASCRPLAPSIKAPPPPPSSSPPSYLSIGSDDDLFSDDSHDRRVRTQLPLPSSTLPPPSSSSSPKPAPLLSSTAALLPRIPISGLDSIPSTLLVLSDDEEGDEQPGKRQKMGDRSSTPLPSTLVSTPSVQPTKPSRSLVNPTSSSLPSSTSAVALTS